MATPLHIRFEVYCYTHGNTQINHHPSTRRCPSFYQWLESMRIQSGRFWCVTVIVSRNFMEYETMSFPTVSNAIKYIETFNQYDFN